MGSTSQGGAAGSSIVHGSNPKQHATSMSIAELTSATLGMAPASKRAAAWAEHVAAAAAAAAAAVRRRRRCCAAEE